VDRLTRKELKTDHFALEVEHGVEYVADHKRQVIRYGAIGLAVLAVIIGVYVYRNYQNGAREDALRAAIRYQDAQVGVGAPEAIMVFATQEEKDKALSKAMTDVATKYSGTEQGGIARFYLGTQAADKGDLATAEKSFKEVAENAPKAYASLAKLSLAPVYKAQGKVAEGERLLRDLVANPTIFVSKEQATIALGQYLASANPQEARKLIEPLRSERGPISRAALTALADIPQK